MYGRLRWKQYPGGERIWYFVCPQEAKIIIEVAKISHEVERQERHTTLTIWVVKITLGALPKSYDPFVQVVLREDELPHFKQNYKNLLFEEAKRRTRFTTSRGIVNHQGKGTFWNILQRPCDESWAK
jgi:hypothetical protein